MPKCGPVLKCLLAALAGAVTLTLTGCSTPCDVRLCAPIIPNTSAPPAPPEPQYAPPPPPPEIESIRTVPIDAPDAPDSPAAPQDRAPPPAGGRVTHLGLILPLRSAGLAAPADALRAGFMAAFERDKSGFELQIIETGDNPQETLDAYQRALVDNDIIIGPLSRSAVGALANSPLVKKPTIALNHPEVRGRPLPPQMLIIGLSIEDEAKQVAEWAADEHPAGPALVVTGASAWQRRIASSFTARFKQLGHEVQTVELAGSNGYLSEAALSQLRGQLGASPPALVFTALDPSQAGQVRAALGANDPASSGLPFYGTSSVNPGADPTTTIPDLVGMRMLDLPWEVQPSHPAAMVYPRWSGNGQALDMDRLYALGIDAFRVAREISLREGGSFDLDGVTGKLRIDFGRGPARFERVQPAAVYQGGGFSLINGQQ
ncbi:MAG: penicillin-binding protein activator [Massilia sp.]